jgi:hypothetical protein
MRMCKEKEEQKKEKIYKSKQAHDDTLFYSILVTL